MQQRIICSGFGGQGVLTMGLLLAYSLHKDGKKITWYPSYGSEMRGGTANCMVKYSDEDIASPFIKEADIVITLNEPAIAKFEDYLVPNGHLFVNASLVGERNYREDIHVHFVDTKKLAQAANNPKGENIAMLGAVLKAIPMLPVADFEEAIRKFFADRGKSAFHEANRNALYEGYNSL